MLYFWKILCITLHALHQSEYEILFIKCYGNWGLSFHEESKKNLTNGKVNKEMQNPAIMANHALKQCNGTQFRIRGFFGVKAYPKIILYDVWVSQRNIDLWCDISLNKIMEGPIKTFNFTNSLWVILKSPFQKKKITHTGDTNSLNRCG